MNFAIIKDLVERCAEKGIRHAVLCPGSRSAPLTLAFARNKKIKCWTFSDERSAAFIGLGMAQQTKTPVALVCTSGSAAYNFSPAIAEAWFQQIPLIIFTADRPKEWIDQFDGQTIRQTELYGRHVKKHVELPLDYTHPDSEWYANRMVNEVINLAQSGQKGPVHINAPFREPLYPSGNENSKPKAGRVIESMMGESTLSSKEWTGIKQALTHCKKILVVAGQNDDDPALTNALTAFHSVHSWPFVGDVLGNLHSLPFYCQHSDTFLGQLPENSKQLLQPDLLITFGKSLIAKNLKLYLRTYKPKQHWHLQPSGDTADTFQSLTKVIAVSPTHFFDQLKKIPLPPQKTWRTYEEMWLDLELKAKKEIKKFFQTKRPGEFSLVKQVIEALPGQCNLHLANSMTVRYANHIGLTASQKKVSVFSNRGTSGIDGCSSTAVGHALTSKIPNVLITGDLAFFYDRNAFWHNYVLPNLFVIVLNNHGGIIFNLIDGPAGLPEAEEFFITRQQLNAKSLASEFGFTYMEASRTDLEAFFKIKKNVKILETESSQSINKKIFEEFKKHIKNRYES